MVEIRPIVEGEGEPFLRLLCKVFALDYKRAESIFFNEPLFDFHRKWALFENERMVSILTTVPLRFGWGNAVGIAGVATEPSQRRRGLSGRLLRHVLAIAKDHGEGVAFLLARDARLYERVGFRILDEVVRGSIQDTRRHEARRPLSIEEVQCSYNAWADGQPERLRRDERRWRYWKWNLRVCTEVAGGYACVEGTTVRELVADPPPSDGWGLGPAVEWFGLKTMAQRLSLDLAGVKSELHLMGFEAPAVPQMFMTDQF